MTMPTATESLPVLDVVAAVAEMARELVALRSRVVKLEHANEQLFTDWDAATKRLHEARARLVEFKEGEKGGEPVGPEGEA
jgi:hypothetical protein